MALKLDRYIKNSSGDKVELFVTSLNLELKHKEFLKEKNLNLSKMVREFLDQLMKENK